MVVFFSCQSIRTMDFVKSEWWAAPVQRLSALEENVGMGGIKDHVLVYCNGVVAGTIFSFQYEQGWVVIILVQVVLCVSNEHSRFACFDNNMVKHVIDLF